MHDAIIAAQLQRQRVTWEDSRSARARYTGSQITLAAVIAVALIPIIEQHQCLNIVRRVFKWVGL